MRPEIAKLSVKYGLTELSVFGSTARHEARPDSDVDFLYVRGLTPFEAWPSYDFRTSSGRCSAGLLISYLKTACTGSSVTVSFATPRSSMQPDLRRDSLYLADIVEAVSRSR